jgi:hypothetical protein
MTAHLDDERLSASLDGDEPSAAAHLQGCDDCRARLDSLRAVAAAVAAPVPPLDADRRDAAIAAALAAPSSAGADNVVPLHRPARRPFALGAAALLLVVLVAVTVLSKGDDKGDRAALSSGDMQALSDEAGRVPDGGDLGDQSDPTALASRLRAVLEPPAPDAAADSTGAEGGGASGAAAMQAPTAAEAKAARRGGGESFSTNSPDCTATVAREYGRGLGPLAYRAGLRWEGTPAVVLVYPITGATGNLDRRVLVMAQADCRLLVAQTI